MNLSNKHKRYWAIAGFLMMLVLMVVLNNRIEKNNHQQPDQKEIVISVETNNSGIAPLTAQIPHNPEGTLPIKLISNTNSTFLVFINNSFEVKNIYLFTQCRKRFLSYCSKLQLFFRTEFMTTTRNKDIR